MASEVVSSSASSSFVSEEPSSDPRGVGRVGATSRSPELTLNAAAVNESGAAGPNNLHVNKGGGGGGARTGAAENLYSGSPTHRGGNGAAAAAAAAAAASRFVDPKDENGFNVFSRRPTATGPPPTSSHQPSAAAAATFAQAAGNGGGVFTTRTPASASQEHPAVIEFTAGLAERHLKCALCAKIVVDVVLIGSPASSIACRRCAEALPRTNIAELPRPLKELIRAVKLACGAPDLKDDAVAERRILRARRPGPVATSHPSAAAATAAKEEIDGAAASSSTLSTSAAAAAAVAAAAAAASVAAQAVLVELTDAEAAERQQICSAEAASRGAVGARRSAAKPSGVTSRQYKLEADRKYESAEYTAAVELYTKAIKMQPVDRLSNVKFLYGNRSAAHYMAQRYLECIEDCLEVVRLDPSSVKMLSRAARSASTMGDLNRAVEILESAPKELRSDDMEAELVRYRGGLETYRHAERCFGTPEGDEQYRMLVVQFNDTVPFRVRSAESLRKQQHYLRAVEVLDVLSASTLTPAACRVMSECLYLSGFEFFERARKCIVDVAQLDDACNELLKKIDAVDDGKQKGNTNFNKKNYGPAAEFYTVAIQAAADNDQVLRVLYCNRAAAYKELGRYREGVEDCTKTLHIDKEFYKAYARRARCHEHLGDHFAAVRDFKKATEYDGADRELARELKAAEQNLSKEAERERDFYFQLGISRTATEREIKLKYRELSLRWHPDKCIGLDEMERERAEHKFKIISEAHATLVDPVKRREYDAKQERERFTRPGTFNFASTYSGGTTNDFYRGRHRSGGNGFW